MLDRVFSSSRDTQIEFVRERELSELAPRVQAVSKCLGSEAAALSLYVYAMGSQPVRRARALKGLPGVEVVLKRSLLPRWLRFLSVVVASDEILVRVRDVCQLPQAFALVSAGAMVGIYAFDAGLATRFENNILVKGKDTLLDFGIKADAGYFILVFDADSFESSTGVFEMVSVGTEAKACLKQAVTVS